MQMNKFAGSLILSAMLSSWGQVQAADTKTAAPTVPYATSVTQPTAEVSAPLTASLAQAIADFKSAGNDSNWTTVVMALKNLLSDSQASQQELAKLLVSVPQLSQLGLKVFDAGQARVWSFPQISQSHELIIEWRESKSIKPPGAKTATKAISAHTQIINVPNNILVSEAKVVNVPQGPAPAAAKNPNGKNAPVKAVAIKPVNTSKYLILTGNDKVNRTIWWSSYKFTGPGWVPTPELLSSVPPNLVNNVTGKVGISGSDLVVTVTPGQSFASGTNGTPTQADYSAYKLVFHLSGGKYLLEGKGADDSIHGVIYQFIRAVREGKMELAKNWVADPKLASIPKYIGLSLKNVDSQLRLVSMPGPLSGAQRFRLVTFGRDDLIFDVGKVNDPRTKQIQWIIKAIFVAPADPGLQKFASSLPTFDWIGAPDQMEDQKAVATKAVSKPAE